MKKVMKIIVLLIIMLFIYFSLSTKVNYNHLLFEDIIMILVFVIIYASIVFLIIRNNSVPNISKIKSIGYKEPSYDEYNNIIKNNQLLNLFMITTDNKKYDHEEFITDDSGRIVFKIKQNMFSDSYKIYNPFDVLIGKISRSGLFVIQVKIKLWNRKYFIKKKFDLNRLIFNVINSDYYIESIGNGIKGVLYKGEEKIGAVDELIDKNPKLERHVYFKIYNEECIYESIALILGLFSIKRLVKDI